MDSLSPAQSQRSLVKRPLDPPEVLVRPKTLSPMCLPQNRVKVTLIYVLSPSKSFDKERVSLNVVLASFEMLDNRGKKSGAAEAPSG